jgi:hypothetical protein
MIVEQEHRDRLVRLTTTELLTVHWAGHDDS